jgi:hypothetical protein
MLLRNRPLSLVPAHSAHAQVIGAFSSYAKIAAAHHSKRLPYMVCTGARPILAAVSCPGKRARPTRSASLISRIGVWQVTYEKQCVHPLTSDPCFLLWSVIEGVSCAGEVAFTPDLVLDRICDLSKFKAY